MQEIDLTYWDCKGDPEWEGWTGAHFDSRPAVTIFILGEQRLPEFILWLFDTLKQAEQSRKHKGSLAGVWGVEMQAVQDGDALLVRWKEWPNCFISVKGGKHALKQWFGYLVQLAVNMAKGAA